MTEELKKSDSHYVLVVDRDIDDILGCLAQVVMTDQANGEKFLALYRAVGVSDAKVLEYFKKSADKNHEMGWCRDPFCKDKRPKKV